MPSTDHLLLTVAVFVLAGFVKGVVGLGLPTIAMALLALVMPPATAAALLIVPSLVTNVWQLRPGATLSPLLRRLAPMQAGVCVGTLAGAWVLGAPVGAWATVSLGVALVAYALWALSGARIAVGPVGEKYVGPWVGALTGFVTAATGVFVIPAVPYLQALGFEREELIQAMGLSFTVSTLALAAGLYVNAPESGGAHWGLSLLMLAPALLGMQAGQGLRQRLPPALFRTCFLAGLMLLGIHMVAREALAG
ncbi:sulfite exporter TauE/SafE family protein [Corallococcus macrosporus]|uniref:Probable membrane transporter protein n=1 Tax=Corallococcus macrosporus DSM 14697 TaxID=1189310 RepID=A0A250JSD4_9BACT|nr:sulfite exporter TauE/SafE family protein [Corallococcus macrosporus]ATB46603.1 membrane protein [Corallococcus macrosporus DSM 14697]